MSARPEWERLNRIVCLDDVDRPVVRIGKLSCQVAIEAVTQECIPAGLGSFSARRFRQYSHRKRKIRADHDDPFALADDCRNQTDIGTGIKPGLIRTGCASGAQAYKRNDSSDVFLQTGLERCRNVANSCGPSGVKMLSGWNCTPSSASFLCRTPMTSPSAVHAVTSNVSGTRRALRSANDSGRAGKGFGNAAVSRPLVKDLRRLAVHQPSLRARSTRRRPPRALVPEAHAEHRDLASEGADHVFRHTRLGRNARVRGDAQVRRLDLTRRLDVISSFRCTRTSAPSTRKACTRL